MTAENAVAETEASGGTVLGIEVDVRDHEAVEAMAARVVREWVRSMCWSRMQEAVAVGPSIRRPALLIRRC